METWLGERPSRTQALVSEAEKAQDRAAIGRRLRERVEAAHSVEHWADGVLGAI